VSHSGRMIATACKATSPEHAVIRLYETSSWKLIGEPLTGHTLTVTRMAFSPDDHFLLSVSRDRSWCLFDLHTTSGWWRFGQQILVKYLPTERKLIQHDKSHGRVIWDCCWSHDGKFFITASRDKTVGCFSFTLSLGHQS
jgi:WD40 repeat protein